MFTAPGTDNVYLGGYFGECLLKSDYEGNASIADDGHTFFGSYPNTSNKYLLTNRTIAKNNESEATSTQLVLLDKDTGSEVREIKEPNLKVSKKDSISYSALSDNGNMMLIKYEKRIDSGDDDYRTPTSVYLEDTKTGQTSKLPIKTERISELQFSDNDQKILVAYDDKKDSDKLHIDIYKSNIPHSVIDDALYFAQNNLPVVIGGGVVLVLIIGGVVVVCVRRRKKRSGSKDDASGTAPKTKKQKCGRRRKKDQQEDASAASADVATQQTVSQPAAPAPQPDVAPAASPAPAQQPPAAAPQHPTPQPPATAASAPRFCRHCGSPLTPGSKFCPKCGHPVE